jgi:uncharacterized coiled-coil protein SlyX
MARLEELERRVAELEKQVAAQLQKTLETVRAESGVGG